MGNGIDPSTTQQTTAYQPTVQGSSQDTQEVDSSTAETSSSEALFGNANDEEIAKVADSLDENMVNMILEIEQSIGIDNFLDQIDENGDGEVDDKETQALVDSDENISIDQVNDFIHVLQFLNNMDSKEDDSTSKTDDASTSKTDDNPEREVARTETTEPKDGKVTTNEYDADGKLISSVTKSEDGSTVLYKRTFNNQGKVATEKFYYNTITGEKSDNFYVHKYDDEGREIGLTLYHGEDENGEMVKDYEYSYDGENGDKNHPSSRIDKATGEKMIYNYNDDFTVTGVTFEDADGNILRSEEYTYDENNKRTKTEHKDKDGNLEKTETFDKNGMLLTVIEDDSTSVCTYSDLGIKEKEVKYDKNSVDENGKVADDASPIEEIRYEDGEETVKIAYDGDKTSFYEGSKLTAEIKDGYAYVYEYDSSGNKTVAKKYDKSDLDENGKPISGRTPISTEDVSASEGSLARATSASSSLETSAISKDASNKLLELAQTTGGANGTVGWCLGGVSDTLAAAYGADQSLYGIESAKDADTALRGEMAGYEATAAHFSEVTDQYSAEDLANLPAGYIVVYDADPSYGDGVNGHIYVTDGNGGGYSDHYESSEMVRNGVKYSIFAPKD